jgi:hypothetical protein
MSGKPWVYIASPYTKGDCAINVRTQMEAFDQLLSLGVVPIAPLYSHFQHMFIPRPYQDWINLDIEIIQRCDACLRLDAECEFWDGTEYKQSESSGADGEVAEFQRLGKPVFRSVADVHSWLNPHPIDWSKTEVTA